MRPEYLTPDLSTVRQFHPTLDNRGVSKLADKVEAEVESIRRVKAEMYLRRDQSNYIGDLEVIPVAMSAVANRQSRRLCRCLVVWVWGIGGWGSVARPARQRLYNGPSDRQCFGLLLYHSRFFLSWNSIRRDGCFLLTEGMCRPSPSMSGMVGIGYPVRKARWQCPCRRSHHCVRNRYDPAVL